MLIFRFWKFWEHCASVKTTAAETLLSRNFCQKSVRDNFRNFHNVQCRKKIYSEKYFVKSTNNQTWIMISRRYEMINRYILLIRFLNLRKLWILFLVLYRNGFTIEDKDQHQNWELLPKTDKFVQDAKQSLL